MTVMILDRGQRTTQQALFKIEAEGNPLIFKNWTIEKFYSNHSPLDDEKVNYQL